MPSREPELYKDKIEVSLDGRQIFYLFFGGAVIVGMVFVVGVMVGRRVEARGHVDRAETPTASDPLAALDRLERSENLSFQRALTGGHATTDVEKTIGELEKRRAAAARAEPSKPEARTEPKPEAKPETKTEAKTDPVTKPESDAKTDTKTEAKSDKHEKRSKKHDDSAAETRPESKDPKESKDVKERYTVQLSSFQDKSEAEAFLAAIKSAGFQPYLTEAEVNGKGTFYRVRLGSYRSIDAANDAKAEYEKSANAKKTAQVMRL